MRKCQLSIENFITAVGHKENKFYFAWSNIGRFVVILDQSLTKRFLIICIILHNFMLMKSYISLLVMKFLNSLPVFFIWRWRLDTITYTSLPLSKTIEKLWKSWKWQTKFLSRRHYEEWMFSVFGSVIRLFV